MIKIKKVLQIANKEILYSLNSKIIVFILAFYILMFISNVYFMNIKNDYLPHDANSYLTDLSNILSFYGSAIIIVIGSYSIFKEKDNSSLNVMVCKPVYRDTIINGKLIGIYAFMIFLILFSAIFYLSMALVFFRNAIGDSLILFIGKLPLVFMFSLLSMSIFLAISMLLSILIFEKGLAIFSSFIIWVISMVDIHNIVIAGYLGNFVETQFGLYVDSVTRCISSLSPITTSSIIMSNSNDIFITLANCKFDLLRLLIFSIVPLIFMHIAFTRRDIT